ncbi:glycosyltransferase [Mammaliicoccus vitulinus]|uniref:glycosyltransferase n=1 Tax=Mammaliicoccus vitulinus TaxID=71237 RepID=UPI002DB57AF5|nr:glycosyltransferase [Mammaliicoccus vitulinus]MEB7657770.1 glycosyltransferase [Mammaliicoccus vitulinus]
MKICHICLCGYFSENYGYQDNLMVEENLKSGHDVSVISSQYQWGEGGEVNKVSSGKYEYNNALQIYRIPFFMDGFSFLNNKIRKYTNLYDTLIKIQPDIIFVHGFQFVDIKEIIKYKKHNVNVKLYGDNHASYHNSSQNFFSKYLLHRTIYKYFIKKYEDYFEKIFNVTIDCEKFFKESYNVTHNLHYLPLCGKRIDSFEIMIYREEIRNSLGMKAEDIVYIHAGKLENDKKTIETMKTFEKYNIKGKLIIVGSVKKDIKNQFEEILKNSQNIIYIGWVTSDSLIKYLCASDIFVQLGSQSILFQQGISCSNMVIFDDNINTEYLVSNNNGLTVSNMNQFGEIITKINNNEIDIEEYKKNSYEFAEHILNYESQSKEYIEV